MRLGPFELIRIIATGGMGEVFVARQVGLAGFERRAVIKRILPEHCKDEAFVALFLDEARLAAKLVHPNIVHVYELGFDKGSYFIALEYVSGCDLASLLDAQRGALPLGEAFFIDYVPFRLQTADLLLVLAAVAALTFLCAAVAARRATMMSPVEALRR